MEQKIWAAFEPITALMRGVAYPLAYLAIMAGIILVMLGRTREGWRYIKWAALGYLAVQFAPAAMRLLSEVGQAIAR
jgi:hypothetical protein